MPNSNSNSGDIWVTAPLLVILGKLESPWKAIEYLESLEDEEPTSGQQRERERFGESGSATTKVFFFHSLFIESLLVKDTVPPHEYSVALPYSITFTKRK